jgi:hypothetical protein
MKIREARQDEFAPPVDDRERGVFFGDFVKDPRRFTFPAYEICPGAGFKAPGVPAPAEIPLEDKAVALHYSSIVKPGGFANLYLAPFASPVNGVVFFGK